MNSKIRVRFAPSPTGHLHIGSVRTAVFNWLFARHHNGTFLIRIEDTDTERSKKEYTDSILESLAWFDLNSDEPVVTQSLRFDEHKKLINQLLKEGKAYKCYCTQEEVVQRYQAQAQTDDEFVKYDGLCANQERDSNKPYVVRFKLPTDCKDVAFDDLIRGRIVIDMDQLDDFIIARSDGRPMYNFVVVTDDAHAKISHIIRGEDHISNTPKQILLYEAFNYPVPQFAHLPMILGASGQRLSKRDAATSILEYKHEGFLPDALFNYLVRLGWSHGDQEIFSRKELIELFTLKAVNKKAAIFDTEKLLWLNGIYIKEADSAFLFDTIVQDVDANFKQQLNQWSQEQIYIFINLYKERVHTLKELVHELRMVHTIPTLYDTADMQKWITSDTPKHLQAVIKTLEGLDTFAVDIITEVVKQQSKMLGIKLGALGQPIRIALLGKSTGPGFFALLAALGKKESIERLERLLSVLKK